MKKLLNSMLIFFVLVFCSCAEDEEPEWNAAEVCPEIGTNIYGMPNRGTFVDERDGREYKYTTIGNQVWMAENLKYEAPYSTCDMGEPTFDRYCNLIEHECDTKECCAESWCERFGRLYSIIKEGESQGLIDRAFADTLCPKGWHIPTKAEWEILIDSMKVGSDDGYDVAKRLLNSDSVNFYMSLNSLNNLNETRAGIDACAMSILPSGCIDGVNKKVHLTAFWTSSQESSSFVWTCRIQLGISFGINDSRNSIRCLKD